MDVIIQAGSVTVTDRGRPQLLPLVLVEAAPCLLHQLRIIAHAQPLHTDLKNTDARRPTLQTAPVAIIIGTATTPITRRRLDKTRYHTTIAVQACPQHPRHTLDTPSVALHLEQFLARTHPVSILPEPQHVGGLLPIHTPDAVHHRSNPATQRVNPGGPRQTAITSVVATPLLQLEAPEAGKKTTTALVIASLLTGRLPETVEGRSLQQT